MIGRYLPDLGNSLATSSYVAISSLSKSSFSVTSYMIFFVLVLDPAQPVEVMGDSWSAEERKGAQKSGTPFSGIFCLPTPQRSEDLPSFSAWRSLRSWRILFS